MPGQGEERIEHTIRRKEEKKKKGKFAALLVPAFRAPAATRTLSFSEPEGFLHVLTRVKSAHAHRLSVKLSGCPIRGRWGRAAGGKRPCSSAHVAAGRARLSAQQRGGVSTGCLSFALFFANCSTKTWPRFWGPPHLRHTHTPTLTTTFCCKKSQAEKGKDVLWNVTLEYPSNRLCASRSHAPSPPGPRCGR